MHHSTCWVLFTSQTYITLIRRQRKNHMMTYTLVGKREIWQDLLIADEIANLEIR